MGAASSHQPPVVPSSAMPPTVVPSSARRLLDDDIYGDELCLTLATWAYILLALTIVQILIIYCVITPGIRRQNLATVRAGAYGMMFLGLVKIAGGIALSAVSQMNDCTFQTFYGILCIFLGALWIMRGRRFLNILHCLEHCPEGNPEAYRHLPAPGHVTTVAYPSGAPINPSYNPSLASAPPTVPYTEPAPPEYTEQDTNKQPLMA